jgi:hypothetical protein
MFSISAKLEGNWDIDGAEVEVECPRCRFANPVWLWQIRLRDVIICRGCKCNLHLEDQMNTFRKARESLNRQMQELKRTLERAFR